MPSSPPDLRPSGRGPGKTSILFGEIRASASIFCVLEKVSLSGHGALGRATRRRSLKIICTIVVVCSLVGMFVMFYEEKTFPLPG